MSEHLSGDRVRILTAPCGCDAGADATDAVPGFCRSKSEAAEDLRNGFTERIIAMTEFRSIVNMKCVHDPEWGVA